MWKHVVLGSLAALCVATGASRAQVPAECRPAVDAATKEVATPHHAYSTERSASAKEPRTGEVIFVDGTTYVLYSGAWRRIPITAQQALEQRQEAIRGSKFSGCRQLRTETVDGMPAAVYAMHIDSENGGSDVQVWIAKSTGLELREEVDRGDRDGRGKTHVSTRIEYTNVRAPARPR